MNRLIGAVKHYPWGSRHALARLRGESAPAASPEAELWFGAHPAGSATTHEGVDLCSAIEADPAAALGDRVVADHGGRLPFLVKLLAADSPLSLQAHPSREQARAGFAGENTAGLAASDPRRNYRDASAKPEVVLAVEEFTALAGFRGPRESAQFLKSIGASELDGCADRLESTDDGLRTVVAEWSTMSSDDTADLVARIRPGLTACARTDSEWAAPAAAIADLAARHPRDPGVLVAMLLNHVVLAPGEALFLPAGHLHSYLSGVGVEVMASSDNVVRGGLTAKHVDVDELLRIVEFSGLMPHRFAAAGPGTTRLPLPIDDVAVTHVVVDQDTEATRFTESGPRILVVVAGRVHVCGVAGALTPGESLWARAADGPLTVAASPGAEYVVVSLPDR